VLGRDAEFEQQIVSAAGRGKWDSDGGEHCGAIQFLCMDEK